jgi:predicted ferric reductase
VAGDVTLRARPRRAFTGWDLGVLVAANGAVVVGLWVRQGGLRDVHDAATLLTSLGRVTGLLGAFLALVELLLLARLPVLDTISLDRVAVWHRRNGAACLTLIAAHAVLTTAGYALTDGVGFLDELGDLLGRYSGVLLATIALGLLVAVVATSVVLVRRRIGYRTWHALHVLAYVAVGLAFSHQLATGQEFQRQPVARAYWWALYGAVVVTLVGFRIVLPVVRSLRHGLRVERVVQEAPGVVSVEVGGRDLDRLRALPGQSLRWRFLARGHWHEAHPFSLSAAPDGRRLRITVKELGDYTARMATLRPGTRVIVEGPYGGLTAAARRRPRAALIAGGVGITPIRALLEDMPGEIVVIYRAGREDDLLFRGELDELSRRRGVQVHYVIGESADGLLSPEHLRELVPDIVDRDVYVCGPVSMTEAMRASLRHAGVRSRQIISEAFG